jgi:hypothetical protein
LKAAGVTNAEAREECLDRRDSIANLQLLAGPENQSKSDTPFAEWFAEQTGGDRDADAAYRRKHYIPEKSLGLADFLTFTEARRELMKEELRRLLMTRS